MAEILECRNLQQALEFTETNGYPVRIATTQWAWGSSVGVKNHPDVVYDALMLEIRFKSAQNRSPTRTVWLSKV